jgi:hypothetical protein
MSAMAPPKPQDAPEPEQSSFELDPAQLGGVEYEPGEVLQLKVVGKTSEGMLEVQHVAPENKGDMGWEKDFDMSMAPGAQEPQAPATDGGGAEEAS